MSPSALFFGCRTPEKLTRKAGLEVCGRLLRLVIDWERNTPSRQSLPVRESNIGLFSLNCLYTSCFQASSRKFAHVGAERQTNIHTCIHTHTLFIKQFQETRRTPKAGFGRTPGFKKSNKMRGNFTL